jgi:3',5'-cyclic AMP phosphodiesterase CpdA
MANKKIAWTAFLFLMIFFAFGCSKELDFSGFIRSTDSANERFEQSVQWNNVHQQRIINLDTASYNIVVGGDTHVGGTVYLSSLLDQSKIPEISAVILAGDVSTGNKEDYDVLKKTLDNTDSASYYLTNGNHDLFFNGWDTYYSYFGASSYTIVVNTPQGSDLYICLDTGGGTLGDLQLAWLKDILENQRSLYRNCIIITHVNFFRNRFTASTNPLVDELYVLMDLFAANNVNMVISGHDHERYEEVFGVTTYITLDALVDGCSNASYLKLNVNNGKLNYQFIPL